MRSLSNVLDTASQTGQPLSVLSLSWQSVFDGIDALAYMLAPMQPSIVIGISRGGLIPATLLSHRLGIRMETVKAAAYEGTRRTLQRPIVIEGWKDFYNAPHVVVVDDILDTGDTFEALKSKAGFDQRKFKFATLVTKNTQANSLFYAKVDPRLWVKFPWEGDET